MAPEPQKPPKRLNYFTHQFLREQDFKDEQDYHLQARRRHNQLFHSWGVLEGLAVRQKGETEIVVDPGSAVDKEGREIILAESVTRSLSSFAHDSEAYISVGWLEELKDEDHVSAGGVEGYVRVTELAEVHEQRHEHVDPDAIVLARVRVGPRGHVEHVDMSPEIRKTAKAAGSAVSGWLRMPFKPFRMNSIDPEDEGGNEEFSLDEVNAFCGRNGARGSMHIPVPPGATRVTGFRVAGTTQGEIKVRLYRTGWNVAENAGEKSRLRQEKLVGDFFHNELEMDEPLDESHALSVSIRANNQSEIWLIAVRFD